MPATILVVDDEVAIRRLLRNTLEQAGHLVVEARDGREALARAAAEHPDAVLLDLGLPDRDGLSLIPLLRAAERFRRASAERRRRASAPAQAPQADAPSPGEDDPAAERDARP